MRYRWIWLALFVLLVFTKFQSTAVVCLINFWVWTFMNELSKIKKGGQS